MFALNPYVVAYSSCLQHNDMIVETVEQKHGTVMLEWYFALFLEEARTSIEE